MWETLIRCKHIDSLVSSNPALGSNETSGDGSNYTTVGLTFLIDSVLHQCRSKSED